MNQTEQTIEQCWLCFQYDVTTAKPGNVGLCSGCLEHLQGAIEYQGGQNGETDKANR